MDAQTVAVYDAKAEKIAALHRAVEPELIYRLVGEYFIAAAATADIGCGSGRDTAWLAAHGFPLTGYDASRGLLEQARTAYPWIELRHAALPDVAALGDETFHNILCNAVLMHVPRPEHGRSFEALSRIMLPGGRLILTFRPSLETDEREADGRLFAAPTLEKLDAALAAAGLELLRIEHGSDARPDVRWFAVVAEKRSAAAQLGAVQKFGGALVTDADGLAVQLAQQHGDDQARR